VTAGRLSPKDAETRRIVDAMTAQIDAAAARLDTMPADERRASVVTFARARSYLVNDVLDAVPLTVALRVLVCIQSADAFIKRAA
jgi:hypothetical protein